MALPALQETFEHLSAETKRHSEPIARADVVSFPMARMIEIVDRVVEHQRTLRMAFNDANRDLAEALRVPHGLADMTLEKRAEILVTMKRVLREMRRPYLAGVDGEGSLLTTAQILRSMHTAKTADGRIILGQAKRIEDSAELCEAQRLRFVSLTEQGVAALDHAPMPDRQAWSDALFAVTVRRSIERYPVINEHLAK